MISRILICLICFYNSSFGEASNLANCIVIPEYNEKYSRHPRPSPWHVAGVGIPSHMGHCGLQKYLQHKQILKNSILLLSKALHWHFSMWYIVFVFQRYYKHTSIRLGISNSGKDSQVSPNSSSNVPPTAAKGDVLSDPSINGISKKYWLIICYILGGVCPASPRNSPPSTAVSKNLHQTS